MAVRESEKQPKSGAENKTPAPTRPAPPNLVSAVRAPTAAGYGQNGPQKSYADIGEQVLSPLAANLKASSHSGEDFQLDSVIAHGTGKNDDIANGDWQTRRVDSTEYPSAHGHKHRSANDGSPGDKVPGKIGFNPGTVARKPG